MPTDESTINTAVNAEQLKTSFLPLKLRTRLGLPAIISSRGPIKYKRQKDFKN